MLQRHSIEELHGDERATVLLVNVVDGADVGMVQRRGGASFPPQALQRMPVVSQIVGKKLEGDETAETCVLGLVDHTHPAAAEFFEDAVVQDVLFDHERMSGPGLHPCYGRGKCRSINNRYDTSRGTLR